MHAHGLLDLALVFLLAAVIAVPLFRWLGLGAVLGYLAAGVVIGPDVLGLVPDVAEVMALSELGVVMLLFVIGLELSPSRLWVMRRQVFGLGALQVFASTLAIAAVLLLLAFPLKVAGVVAMGLALSSTAVGLQLMSERRELAAPHGRLGFSLLLFQDIIAIPLLAAIPLLGSALAAEQALPSSAAVLRAVLAIAAVVVGGRFLLRHLFRVVARSRSLETFTAVALLVVAGSAWLMHSAGLSMGLGGFLAGVLLADSEFRHELGSHIEPFKGLLLGLFFISVGMAIDLEVIAREPGLIVLGVLALLALKFTILVAVGGLAGIGARSAMLLGGLLSMGGEFAFVVFSESIRAGLIDRALHDRLVVTVGLSMALTPLLLLLIGRVFRQPAKAIERPADLIDHEHPRVIIAGFGRVGQIVGRMLSAQKIPFTALENSAEQVDLSRRFGNKIYFGDPGRIEVLRAAHADRAEVLVVTTDDPQANLRTVRLVKRHFPQLRVFARARNRQHAFKLMDLGVDAVIRETFHSSLELGRQTMIGLGMSAEQAQARATQFRQHDEQLLREQHHFYDDEAALVATSQEALRDLAALFEADARPGRIDEDERTAAVEPY